ncbi:hypothetical protein F5148DRAFT_1296718 [Russula earlei]|uniref:Uncharacterized protein n=1 Tax=Russula earlei TaxID=71964 RepID=A0ACC0TQW6_9AGAM|nr:hypothetical protein F5148DRAFT_1296718 [Russula earlei]
MILTQNQLCLKPQVERNVWTKVKDAHEKLCSSEWVLNLITRNLESKIGPDDDGSLSKNILAKGSIRSTKSVEDDIPPKGSSLLGIAHQLSHKPVHVPG